MRTCVSGCLLIWGYRDNKGVVFSLCSILLMIFASVIQISVGVLNVGIL